MDRNLLKETEDEEEEMGTLLPAFDSPLDFFAKEGLLVSKRVISSQDGRWSIVQIHSEKCLEQHTALMWQHG